MIRLRRLRLLALGLILTSVASTAQPPTSPTADPGNLILTQNCMICHGRELIEGQRLTSQQWDKVVDKMVGWGSPLKDADKKALLTYLSQKYGTDSAPPIKKTRKPSK